MHVRVVEDTPMLADLLLINLEHEGHIVSVTTSEFGDLLRPEPWQGVDVAIVDLLLSGGETTGEQILRYLMKQQPQIKRIVLSAIASQRPEVIGLADAVFDKPVDFKEIESAIRDIANGR